MIAIARWELPDSRLAREGPSATSALERTRASRSLRSEDFDPAIYASVKETLVAMQHGKCCYCESPITPSGYGDVEHLRPKGGVTDSDHPGYWWLAYDWDNLLLSCKRCNVGHKRNHFPLATGGSARAPGYPVEMEQPLLLDPCRDDPDAHITWRAEVAHAKSPFGKRTIEVLGLNREQRMIADPETGERLRDGLLARRREHYMRLSRVHRHFDLLMSAPREQVVEILGADFDRVLEDLWSEIEDAMVNPAAPYLGMMRAATVESFALT